MPTTEPPTNRRLQLGQPSDGPEGRQGAIRANILAALGRPHDLYRVAVLPLWGDHFRVNIVTGTEPTAVRIPHSYFLAADTRGTIIQAAPPIIRLY